MTAEQSKLLKLEIGMVPVDPRARTLKPKNFNNFISSLEGFKRPGWRYFFTIAK